MNNTTLKTTTKTTSADKVFQMLGFQYKPLEKAILDQLRKIGRQDLIDNYNMKPASLKIIILDNMAAKLGL